MFSGSSCVSQHRACCTPLSKNFHNTVPQPPATARWCFSTLSDSARPYVGTMATSAILSADVHRAAAERAGQGHIFEGWSTLTSSQQAELLEDIGVSPSPAAAAALADVPAQSMPGLFGCNQDISSCTLLCKSPCKAQTTYTHAAACTVPHTALSPSSLHRPTNQGASIGC